MPRIARVCAVDYPHHITQRGNNREAVFFDDEDRCFYLDTLKHYSKKLDIDIWAYCLMTNHVHILAIPRSEDALSKGMGRTNLVYTQYINRKYGRGGRLWQNRFFSTVVDEEVYLWAVVRYIELNPVHAGIASIAADYKWSSCLAHVLGVADDLLSDNSWLDKKDMEAYKDFLSKEDVRIRDTISKATSTGRPLGGLDFIERLSRMIGRDLVPKKPGRKKKEVE